MSIDPDALEEIRARIVLSSLIGRSVALKRAGREYVGLSPFNKEKSPSFYVNDEKRFFHCFSSGKHGDAFTWLMESEGLSFREAAERLAAQAGVASPIAQDPKAQARVQERKELSHWLEEAHAFFQAELRRSRGEAARAYLAKRGLPPTDWERFEIGYAPDSWSAVKDHLVGKGARVDELLRAGLLVASDRGKDPYSHFRNRITFAIRDPGRRLVGFGGRALDPEERAKYVNSPERDIFQKGRLLYRFPEARAALARADGENRPRGLLVVEGYLDAIALARAGFGWAVAPLGTAVTEDQLKLLWSAGSEPVLCFDGDGAGQRAAHRVIDRALPLLGPKQSLRFAFIPDGRDPDDVVREQGPGAMDAILAKTLAFIDVLWERERSSAPLDTPEQRADLKIRLLAAAGKIADEAVAGQYRQMLMERFDEAFGWKPRSRSTPRSSGGGRGSGRRDGADGRATFAEPPTPAALSRTRASHVARQRDAARLLRALLLRPSLMADVGETLARLEFDHPDHVLLRDGLLSAPQGEQTTGTGHVAGPAIDKQRLDVHFAKHDLFDAAERVRLDPTGGVVSICGEDDSDGEAARAWEREAAAYALMVAAPQERVLRQTAILESTAAEDSRAMRSAVGRQPGRLRQDGRVEPGADAKSVDAAVARINERANAALARKGRKRK